MKRVIAGIEVEITRKAIKNLYLYIKPPNGDVKVNVPWHLSRENAEKFILERREWIIKQQEMIRSHPQKVPEEFNDGDEIVLTGVKYQLLYTPKPAENQRFWIEGDKLCLNCRPDEKIELRSAFVDYVYRCYLYDKIAALLPIWERRTGLFSSSWHIRDMKTRWGSCNTKTKRLCFNLQLVSKPVECLEYVLLHELVHIKVPNHGADFKAMMDVYMPEWRNIKKKLNNK